MAKAKAGTEVAVVEPAAPTGDDFIRRATETGALADWDAAYAMVEGELESAEAAHTAAQTRYRGESIDARARGDQDRLTALADELLAAIQKVKLLEIQLEEVGRRRGAAAAEQTRREHAAKLAPLAETLEARTAAMTELAEAIGRVHEAYRRVVELTEAAHPLIPTGHFVGQVFRVEKAWSEPELRDVVENAVIVGLRGRDLVGDARALASMMLEGGYGRYRHEPAALAPVEVEEA